MHILKECQGYATAKYVPENTLVQNIWQVCYTQHLHLWTEEHWKMLFLTTTLSIYIIHVWPK